MHFQLLVCLKFSMTIKEKNDLNIKPTQKVALNLELVPNEIQINPNLLIPTNLKIPNTLTRMKKPGMLS